MERGGGGKGGKEWIYFKALGHIVNQDFRKSDLKTTGIIIPAVLIRNAASPPAPPPPTWSKQNQTLEKDPEKPPISYTLQTILMATQ